MRNSSRAPVSQKRQNVMPAGGEATGRLDESLERAARQQQADISKSFGAVRYFFHSGLAVTSGAFFAATAVAFGADAQRGQQLRLMDDAEQPSLAAHHRQRAQRRVLQHFDAVDLGHPDVEEDEKRLRAAERLLRAENSGQGQQ